MRAYHTSRADIWLYSAMRSRYDRTQDSAASLAAPLLKPLLRQARTTLAARRLTSHSHGAGRVSSRSLISKMTRRSGLAKSPKLSRWAVAACLHAQAGCRRDRQVGRHVERRPAIEGERRSHHAAVANRDQLRQALLVRFLEQPQGIAAVCRRLPDRVREARALLPQTLSQRIQFSLRRTRAERRCRSDRWRSRRLSRQHSPGTKKI